MKKKTIDQSPLPVKESFTDHWKQDLLAGFMVFLLAMPLSLGIAKASGFPPAMGVLTAIIGGLLASVFKVSELSIKGPAAGLITISSAAVIEFGGGDVGWKIACAAIVVMALIQIVFAYFKLGFLSDFFPRSAVHGMLAAIGIIIIAKHIPVLLGDDPEIYKGEGPIELILDIPKFITHAHWHIAVVGVLGLLILFITPLIKINIFKKIPGPMLVLLMAVPLSIFWHLKETEPPYTMVSIGDFWGTIGLAADFSIIGKFVFWKYVFMFLFVGSLESLLTVKAVEDLDPYKRETDFNSDLKAVGAGNFFSGLLGGLPMISEVVRSSANINFGAVTKWSNIFHGFFLLMAMIFLIPLIELTPNAALAAMLIYAGYRLAAPKEFIDTYKIGKEQLAIFLTTVIVTLIEDLLLGVLAGILVKIIFHCINGANLKSLFRTDYILHENEGSTLIELRGVAVFSNLLGFKKIFSKLPHNKNVIIDFSNVILIDHSFMSFMKYFRGEYIRKGGTIDINGLGRHKPLSSHPLATHKLY